jgi:photosystem II stability/assembly factor-like uncharacterized protein
MKKLIVVLILVGMLFVTIGADFTHEINKDVALEQSSLFDQLKRREGKGKVGWAAGCDENDKGFIIYTEDSGENWVSQVDEGGLSMCLGGVSAVNRNTAWVVGDAHDGYGTILRTRNRGKKWVRQGSMGEIPNMDLHAVSAVSPSTAWVVGNSGVILKTKNGGTTWEQQAVDMEPKIFFQDVFAFDKNHVWAVGSDNKNATAKAYILHTSNGGKTWVKQDDSVIPEDVDVLIGVHAANKDIVWTVGHAGFVMISFDGGQNWTPTKRTDTGPFEDNNHVVAISNKLAWVAADYSSIYYTKDGGNTWIDQKAITDGSGSQYMMGITAFNKKEAWAVSQASDGSSGGIYHTQDGGANWVSQTKPIKTNLYMISFAGALR